MPLVVVPGVAGVGVFVVELRRMPGPGPGLVLGCCRRY